MNSYGIKAEMGAKTGTTNNNTDAWFMVYTPELLVGTWVGCDENWIHFPSFSAAGYGGAAALPQCGSFLQSVYKDPKLAYDDEAKFVKPNVDKNDIIYDYFQNITGPPSPDAEGQDVGNGEAGDYFIDEPLATDTSIKAESELPKPDDTKPKPGDKPKPDTPVNKAGEKPKAVMPPTAPAKKENK
jgi:penicillin-binding protein 1A